MKDRKEKEFIPVMLTPFKDNGDIDFDGLANLTELYIKAGARGLFANCQSSEMYSLNDEEKVLIVKKVMKIADGRIPVVAVGNFGETIEQQALFIQKIYDTGVKAVIIVTSLIAEEFESDEVFDEKVLQLFSLTREIPMGFYECPEPYKKVLTAKQLKRFVDTGRVIYHKDTCLDIDMIRAKLAGTQEAPCFGLYDAYVVNAVDSLKAGAAGLSCIQGNFFPELIVWLCENFDNAPANEKVIKVQQFLSDHMEVAHYAYPAVAKYYLQKSGLNISTFTRTRDSILTRGVKSRIDYFFDQYNLLREEIGI